MLKLSSYRRDEQEIVMSNDHSVSEKSLSEAEAPWCKPAIVSLALGLIPFLIYLPAPATAADLLFLAVPLFALGGLITGIIGIRNTRRQHSEGFWFAVLGIGFSLWLCFLSAVMIACAIVIGGMN
jgi:hypothetical protein